MRALRVLVALIALQITGAAHVFADAVFAETLASHVEQERTGGGRDDSDADCPPGCPECHHVTHALPVVIGAPEIERVAAAARVDVAFEPIQKAPSRPRSPPYRPPRA